MWATAVDERELKKIWDQRDIPVILRRTGKGKVLLRGNGRCWPEAASGCKRLRVINAKHDISHFCNSQPTTERRELAASPPHRAHGEVKVRGLRLLRQFPAPQGFSSRNTVRLFDRRRRGDLLRARSSPFL